MEEGSNSECVNDATRNYILFEELPFYFDTENHNSKKHHCKESDAVLHCVLLVNTAFAGISAVGKQHDTKFTDRNLKLRWLEQEKGRGCKAFKLDSRKCLH